MLIHFKFIISNLQHKIQMVIRIVQYYYLHSPSALVDPDDETFSTTRWSFENTLAIIRRLRG